MKQKNIHGIFYTTSASLWWGIIGVFYFNFVSFASPLELTIHRTIWTALLLLLTTFYYSKWKEFNKVIIKPLNLVILFLGNLLNKYQSQNNSASLINILFSYFGIR